MSKFAWEYLELKKMTFGFYKMLKNGRKDRLFERELRSARQIGH